MVEQEAAAIVLPIKVKTNERKIEEQELKIEGLVRNKDDTVLLCLSSCRNADTPTFFISILSYKIFGEYNK